jgi:two-component system, NarL family, sensor kinase
MTSRRAAVLPFLLSAVALLAVVATVGVVGLHRTAESEALRQAGQRTQTVGQSVIEPLLTAGVLRGDPQALRRFDRIVRERVLRDPITRVKLWTPDGRVVYSDEPRLIGKRFPLSDELRQALTSHGPHADLSTLGQAENGFERPQGPRLLEVYLPLWGPSGAEVIAETYQRTTLVDATSHHLWVSFTPVLLVALLALALAQVPLGFWLARRIQAGIRERRRLESLADEATRQERLRIASTLHDGVVQDLAGVAFTLSATSARVDAADPEELRSTLRDAAAVARDSISELRNLLVELCPPAQEIAGLQGALEELAAPLRRRGLAVTLETRIDGERDAARDELLYRAAREALRNVERHAAATAVTVRLEADGMRAWLMVEDDGRGVTAADLAEQRAAGHVGLALLAERVVARGGQLGIVSEPGRGTRLTLDMGRA